MERHKCKLCLRSFSNGRALGGHMRSHMLNYPLPPKPKPDDSPPNQLSEEPESANSSSEGERTGEGEGENKGGVNYGLRENPKRSIRLVDPEFSFAIEAAGSVVLQDRESETESSKNPTRTRSKRNRTHHHHHHGQIQVQEALMKSLSSNFNNNTSKTQSWVDLEPGSSVSDTTTEEDVAFCLMMLSRDKWKRQEKQLEHEQEQEDEEDEEEEAEDYESDGSEELKSSKTRVMRGKYKCETCNKVFRSYQALGGHRASHKKIKISAFTANNNETELAQENAGTSGRKVHECPVCFRVFSSGQALGGHKRTHVTGQTTPLIRRSSHAKIGDNLIDLNLPAPLEDDDMSQIELSAVSDAEFVNPTSQ